MKRVILFIYILGLIHTASFAIDKEETRSNSRFTSAHFEATKNTRPTSKRISKPRFKKKAKQAQHNLIIINVIGDTTVELSDEKAALLFNIIEHNPSQKKKTKTTDISKLPWKKRILAQLKLEESLSNQKQTYSADSNISQEDEEIDIIN